MNALVQSLLSFGNEQPLLALVAWWMVHAAAIVLVAWLGDRLFKGRSAAACHAIWICAFVALGSLLVVNLTSFPLELTLHVEQPVAPETRFDSNTDLAAEPKQAVQPTPLQAENSARVADLERATNDHSVADAPRASDSPNTTQTQIAQTVRAELGDESPAASSTVQSARGLPGMLWIIVAYVAGLVFWLVRTARGWQRLQAIYSRSEPLAGAPLLLAKQCAVSLSLPTMPDCRVAHSAPVPMTWGVLKPVVMVPATFEALSEEDQRHCLLHEMAHIRQRDGIWNWLAQLVTAVYWFHPAVHLAGAGLRRSREDAADDAVIRSGARPSSYSRSLLRIGEWLSGRSRVLPEAISATTNIETRIRRVLDPKMRRQPLYRSVLLAVPLLFIGLSMTTVRVQRVTAREPGVDPQQTAPQSPATGTTAAEEQTAPKGTEVSPASIEPQDPSTLSWTPNLHQRLQQIALTPRAQSKQRRANFRGQVRDAAGRPVSGAVVLISEFNQPRTVDSAAHVTGPFVGRAITDEQGNYSVDDVAPPPRDTTPMPYWNVLVADKKGDVGFAAPGFLFYDQPLDDQGRVTFKSDVNMLVCSEATGRVVTDSGQGIAGARVSVEAFGLEPRKFPTKIPTMPGMAKLNILRQKIAVVTDRNGEFRFQSLPSERFVHLWVQHQDFYPRNVRLSPLDLRNHEVHRMRDDISRKSPIYVEMQSEVQIEFIVETEDGKPVEQYRLYGVKGEYAPSVEITDGKPYVWSTSREQIREFAGRDGRLKLSFLFPTDQRLVNTEVDMTVDELVARKQVRLTAKRGVLLTGRVVDLIDGNGLAKVFACWHKERSLESLVLAHRTRTDQDGNWELVVPQSTGYVSFYGQRSGYKLASSEYLERHPQGDTGFTRRVEFTGQESSVIPELKVERLMSRVVKVSDPNGYRVEGAEVEAFELLPDSEHPVLSHYEQPLVSSRNGPVTTNSFGSAELGMSRWGWNLGTVFVKRFVWDGPPGRYEPLMVQFGRAEFPPDPHAVFIDVQLKNAWRIAGRLIIDGRPAEGMGVSLLLHGNQPVPFLKKQHSFVLQKTDANGEFEFYTEPDHEFAVEVYVDRDGSPPRYYYSPKLSLQQVGPDRFRFPDIEISDSDLKVLKFGTSEAERQ